MQIDSTALNVDANAVITIRKFEGDQTDEPFEEIVIVNGEVVEVRRKEDGTLK